MTTVRELISWLQELDQDAEVYREDNEYGPTIIGDAKPILASSRTIIDMAPAAEGTVVVVIS